MFGKKSKKNSLWEKMDSIFKGIWRVICDLGKGLLKIIHTVFDFCVKSSRLFFLIFFGLIGSVSVFLISVGIFIFLVSKSVGLTESEAFKIHRDRVIQINYLHETKWMDKEEMRLRLEIEEREGSGSVILNQPEEDSKY